MVERQKNDFEIEELSARLKEQGNRGSSEDFRRLYVLIGQSMLQKHGVDSGHNPRSVESISKVVLKRASSIPVGKMLNVGMGGYPLVDIELQKMNFSVTGVEYSESLAKLAVDVAHSAQSNLRAVIADRMKLPFPDASFESCLCSEMLEHVADDLKVVREIHRVLKPGGFF